MNKIFIFSFYLLMLCSSVCAQNVNQADSVTKAKEQLKIESDSLKKVQQLTASSSEKKDQRPFLKRLSFSMSTGFWINPSSTYFELSPTVIYHFPKTYSIGTGPAYIYKRDRIDDVSLNGWGGKLFGKADFTRWLYGWTEYQLVSNQYITGFNSSTNKFIKGNETVDSWFLSLGLNIRLGKRNAINIQALYDVLYKKSNSLYYSPLTYRLGFGF